MIVHSQAEFPIPCTNEELDSIRTWVNVDESVSETIVAEELGEAAFAAAQQACTFTWISHICLCLHYFVPNISMPIVFACP